MPIREALDRRQNVTDALPLYYVKEPQTLLLRGTWAVVLILAVVVCQAF